MKLDAILRKVVPAGWPRALRRGIRRNLDRVSLGDLRRLTPISADFGLERGIPVDRHYVERFLARNASDIRGRVLEIGDDAYTRRFGQAKVTRSDVLHVAAGDPRATIVGDLTDAPQIASDSFDCLVLTQTLQLIYDVRSVVRTSHRILRSGGVLLMTVPGITQTPVQEPWETWYWSFTSLSVRRLLEETFRPDHIAVAAHGNVLSAVAFLHGLASEELTATELDHHDPAYQLLITARAVKVEARS